MSAFDSNLSHFDLILTSCSILLACSDLLLDDQIFIGTLFKGFKGRLLFLAANELDLG